MLLRIIHDLNGTTNSLGVYYRAVISIIFIFYSPLSLRDLICIPRSRTSLFTDVSSSHKRVQLSTVTLTSIIMGYIRSLFSFIRTARLLSICYNFCYRGCQNATMRLLSGLNCHGTGVTGKKICPVIYHDFL